MKQLRWLNELLETGMFWMFFGLAVLGCLAMPGEMPTDVGAPFGVLRDPMLPTAVEPVMSAEALAFLSISGVLGSFYLIVLGYLVFRVAGMLPVFGPWQSRRGCNLHPLSWWVALPTRSIPGARSLLLTAAERSTPLASLASYRGSDAGGLRLAFVVTLVCGVDLVVLRIAWLSFRG